MKTPALHTADDIKQHDVEAKITDGAWTGWVLARPEPFYSWKMRWKLAWMVFTGKADALKWIGQ